MSFRDKLKKQSENTQKETQKNPFTPVIVPKPITKQIKPKTKNTQKTTKNTQKKSGNSQDIEAFVLLGESLFVLRQLSTYKFLAKKPQGNAIRSLIVKIESKIYQK